jgi:hypothetical protein
LIPGLRNADLSGWNTYKEFQPVLINSLAKGDVETLAQYFDKELTVFIGDDSEIYTPEQAKRVIADFFKTNPPQDFELLHEGKSRTGDTQYLIGNLATSNGKFRTQVVTKDSRILQIEFSKE